MSLESACQQLVKEAFVRRALGWGATKSTTAVAGASSNAARATKSTLGGGGKLLGAASNVIAVPLAMSAAKSKATNLLRGIRV